MASITKRRWTHNGVEKEAWAVRYVDENGVRRSKQFEKKKLAEAFLRKAVREVEDGQHVPDGETLTVAAAAKLFLEHQEQRMREGRIGRNRFKKLESTVRRVLIPDVGTIALNKLNRAHVERMYRKQVSEDGVQPVTARERVFELKMVQDFAAKRGWIKTTPVNEVLQDLRGLKKNQRRVMNEDEIRLLLGTAAVRRFNGTARSQARIECMVHIAVFCGLRQGEIFGLKLKHVRFDKGIIEVRHSLLDNDQLKGPKTAAGIRDVRAPTHVMQMIERYKDRFYKEQDRNPHGLLFRTEQGCAFDKATLHRQWHDLISSAVISEDGTPITFHSLRHFCASWLIQNGLSLPEVARYLGHEKFDTTLQIYAHPVMNEAARVEAIERSATALSVERDATLTQTRLSA